MTSEPILESNLAFSAASADFRVVHPLSASPASSAFFNQSNYSPPEQLFQHTQQQNATNNVTEDVTTIFVVGFPDDMQEREFQNMFTFSPGFEAASLKWHCKDQEDDSAPTSGTANAKKQMIGFARFHTRLEALEAVEVLSGKKIDSEKGAVLKAEMAKKNLHIKRGSIAPNALAANSSNSATAAAAAAVVAQQQHHHHLVAAAAADTGSSPLNILSRKMSLRPTYDSFSPLLSDLFSPTECKGDPFGEHPLATSAVNSNAPAPIFNDPFFSLRSHSLDARNGGDMSILSPRAYSLYSRPLGNMISNSSRIINANGSIGSCANQTMAGTMDVDNSPFSYLSKSSPVPNDHTASGVSLFDSQNGNDILTHRMGSISLHTNNVDMRTPSLSSPGYRPNSSNNPADQNPPCNTLYVGNLPPNTSEEELQQVFSKCAGYKRMCFRTKPQGPMCFVEFEDVIFATQAMNDLQGYCLSNSAKGGIRLSFSKNPLFTKPNKENGKQPASISDTSF